MSKSKSTKKNIGLTEFGQAAKEAGHAVVFKRCGAKKEVLEVGHLADPFVAGVSFGEQKEIVK